MPMELHNLGRSYLGDERLHSRRIPEYENELRAHHLE